MACPYGQGIVHAFGIPRASSPGGKRQQAAAIQSFAHANWRFRKRELMQVFKEGGHRLFQSDPECAEIVSKMLADLEQHGMDAVRQYSKKFDDWTPADFELTPARVEAATASVDPRVIEDTDFCQANVRAFARAQMSTLHPLEVETRPG